jgi:hypothetical protein
MQHCSWVDEVQRKGGQRITEQTTLADFPRYRRSAGKPGSRNSVV